MAPLHRTTIALSALVAATFVTPGIEAQSHTATARGLASGPYATMHAKLEKTIFDVDVLEIAIRFDEETKRELARIAGGQAYSEERSRAAARAALHADEALARITFLRDITLDQYLEGAYEDLRRAFEAGLLDEASYQRIVGELPRWFRAVEERGFREGDELYYRIRPGAVRSILVAEDGRMIADRTERGEEFPRAVLGSYFAPGTTFRELLIRSLFR